MLKCLLFLSLVLPVSTQGSKRIIKLFAESDNAQKLMQQQWLAAAKAGCNEREIIVKTYTPKDVLVYKKYNISVKGFTIILIGKDGEEKLRSHSPVTTKKLFAVIDAMPMRKEEASRANNPS